jgi:hypothetical protein
LPPIPKLGRANLPTLTLEEGFLFLLEKVKEKKKRRGGGRSPTKKKRKKRLFLLKICIYFNHWFSFLSGGEKKGCYTTDEA